MVFTIPGNMEQRTGNVLRLASRTITICPKLLGREKDFQRFCRSLAKRIANAEQEDVGGVLTEARNQIATFAGDPPSAAEVALMFACSVVVDVVGKGWRILGRRGPVKFERPSFEGTTPEEIKNRVRSGHLLERDAQLRERSVREFICAMEQRQLGPHGWQSIFSVMRDGRELAQKLEAAVSVPEDQRFNVLAQTISPYVQMVEPGAVCQQTSLRLGDIWRYFRHTWVNPYKSLPGRSMMLLIRDSAATNHPVIGIAALGSSMAQQTLRDEWIGWDCDIFLRRVIENPTKEVAKWLLTSVERLLDSVYSKDFLKEGVLSASVIANPTQNAIRRLLLESERSAQQHRLFPHAAAHKSTTNGEALRTADWEKQARSHLFRAKRAKTLAQLLQIRAALRSVGFRETTDKLKAVLETADGRAAVRQLVRMVKSEHVGIDMMDVIVCGAVAPYNALLGGKLICLLLATPVIIEAYRRKYSTQASIIASSMKGERVVRSPALVLLATTSLYGVGSSQYNRIRVPLKEVGGKGDNKIEYIELGSSKGYGSYQFSESTLMYLKTMLGRAGDGRKVNSIFGEGVNPLMRKIRDGLVAVGLPSDELLRHQNARVVYGVPLAKNFREVLMGFQTRPEYFLAPNKSQAATAAVTRFWIKRWLVSRIQRSETMARIRQETLSYPITHSARVALPHSDEETLFD